MSVETAQGPQPARAKTAAVAWNAATLLRHLVVEAAIGFLIAAAVFVAAAGSLESSSFVYQRF